MLRKVLLGGSSFLVLAIVATTPQPANAANCSSADAGNTTVNASCTGPLTWNGGNLSLNSGVTVSVAGTHINGVAVGLSSSVGVLTNSGSINGNATSGYTDFAGVSNDGAITAIVNNSGARITGSDVGITNSYFGHIDRITNYGQILATVNGASTNGIVNFGSITTLTNARGGTISAASSGIYNSGFNGRGSIGVLSNSGLISSGAIGKAVSNDAGGIIGALNNYSTISAANGHSAIYNSSSSHLGAITNSGVIAGVINNAATSNVLTINGGSGNSNYGLLTGSNAGTPSTSNVGTVGSIISASDVLFATGNTWLNDNVNVTGHSLRVTGGTVKVSNAVTVTGTYNQTGGGLVATSNGTINISGASAATITDTHITISGSNLTAGSYTIVNAAAIGTYTGDTLSITGVRGLSGILTTTDGGNDLVVTLTGTATPDITTTTYTGTGQAAGGAAAGMGSALDAIAAATGPQAVAFQTNVLNVLSALPISAQQTAIKQLAPSQLTPATQAANQAAAPTTSVIEQHELALLDGGVAGAAGATGAAAGSDGHAFGLWGQILGGTALRSGNAQADGYRSQNFGLVSGLDYQLDPDTTLGGALSWVKGWSWGADNSAGSYTTTNSYQITGYGLHRWGPAFVDGQVGFGYNTFDQTRYIGVLQQDAKASYDGEQYLAKAGVGYDFPLGNGLTATPLAGLRFLRAVSDGYQESGSSENLAVDRRGVNSLTQDLGGKVSWKLDSDWGLLTPEVRLAWVHDYTKGPIASSGIMGGQIAFTSTVARPSADGAKLNLAATLDTTGDVSLRAEYEGELRPDYQSHAGLLKATWGF